MSPQEILKYYWGHDAFRAAQEDIIKAVLNKQDTLAILPTGGGKSVCFQVPAIIMPGCCLVISPLIALMEDQVQRLNKMGIPSASIKSGMTWKESAEVLDECVNEGLKFLYVSPERLETKAFRESIRHLPLNLLAIDESHCISQWGYDFRPSYLHISQVRDTFPDIPVLALTASATPEVQSDIMHQLKMRSPKKFTTSFTRKNPLKVRELSIADPDAEQKKSVTCCNNMDLGVTFTMPVWTRKPEEKSRKHGSTTR
jgi:ATP-dependent DNA helicase RecQ